MNTQNKSVEELQQEIAALKIALNVAKKEEKFYVRSVNCKTSNSYHFSMNSFDTLKQLLETKFKESVVSKNENETIVNNDFKQKFIDYVDSLIKADLE